MKYYHSECIFEKGNMNLVLIFTLIIGLANGRESPRNIETSYNEGKEYLYFYESQVLSGLPEGAKSVAGLKLESSVIMQMVSDWKFKVQLDSPRLYKINDVVKSEEPLQELLSSDEMEELLDEDVEKMKLNLCKPVTFTYLRGHVHDVKTELDDPEWSVNVKRGFLSLLELNFNQRQSLDRDVHVVMSNSEPKIYRVIEPCTAGECETRYRVKPERSDDDVPSMKIQKIRDFDRCMEKVIHTLDILNGRPCHTCGEGRSRERISAQSSVRYELLGSPDQYIIVSAMSESHYNFVPYSEEAGKLTTVSRQALTLLNDGPIHDQINDLQSPVHHERPLKVKMTEDVRSPLSPEKLELKKEEKEIVLKKVEKLLTGMEELLKDKVDEESGELLLELYTLLRKLDKHSLNKLLDDLLSKENPLSKSRKVLTDILPSLGTYSSLDVLLERSEKSEIPKDSAVAAMMTLSLLPEPDVFFVKRLMDFIKTRDLDEEMKHMLLRRSSWLALASLGNKMMKVSQSSLKDIENEQKALEEVRIESNEQEIRRKLDVRLEEIKNKETQTREVYTAEKQHIINMVKKLYAKEDKDSRLLVVKVMGNLGYEEFLPMLEAMLKDEESHETLKVETINSLWHVVKSDPKLIEKIILPICLDHKQHDVVRMKAIDVVLHGLKSRSAIEMIVETLEEKPNDNIGHYVLSCLVELSKQPAVCDGMKSLARNSSFARRYASKMFSDDHLKSRMHIYSDYNEKLRMGHLYKQTILFSPEETTPSLFKLSYSAVLLGKITDVLELTYNGMGMDSILDTLLEDSIDTSLETVLKTILHPRNRRSSESETEQKIKDIKEKLEIEPLVPREFNGHLNIHLMGYELMYIDTEYFDSLGSEPRREKPETKTSMLKTLSDKLKFIDTLKKLMKLQRTVVLPLLHTTLMTETGLPLKLRIDSLGLMKMEGDLKIEPDNSSHRKSLISKVDAMVKVRPSALLELRCTMEVDMEHIRSGLSVNSKIHMDVPVSLSINFDPDVSKLLMKVRDEKKIRPLKLDLHSYTMIKRIPRSAEEYPLPPERKEISVIDGTDMKVTLYEMGKEVLGRSLTVISERSVRKDSLVPLPPFCGKQAIHMEYEPHSDHGLDVQFQHVRVNDEMDEESDTSWLSKLTSWFSGEPSESSVERFGEESSSSESDERDDSIEDFLDLREKDLSMKYLKEKFRKHTDMMAHGYKCGLVLHIVDQKLEKEHEIQLSSFFQKDQSKLRTSYSVELKMRTKPEKERNVWKMVTDMKLDLPQRDLEPSDLLDSQYQRMVMEDIRLSVRHNGKSVDSLLDLGSRVLTAAFTKIKELESRESSHDRFEDVINYVLDIASDADSVKLEKNVQRQRMLLREAKEFRTTLDNEVSEVERIMKNVEKIFEMSKDINLEVHNILDDTVKGKQEPEDAVMVLYVSTHQEKLHEELKKIVEKLLPLLDPEEQKDVVLKLDEHEKLIDRCTEKQLEHSEKKQPLERQKSTIEVAPIDREFHSTLLDVERKLIDLLVSKNDLKKNERSRIDFNDKNKKLEVIVRDLSDVKRELDGKLMEKGGLERVFRVKLLEIMLYQKLSIIDIEKDITEIEKETWVDELENPKTASDNMIENSKRLLVEKKEELDRTAEEFTERLAVTIESKKRILSLLPHEKDHMHMMFKVKLDQIYVLENLRKEMSDKSTERDHKSIREIADRVMDISKSIEEIIDTKPEDENMEKEYPLHPVLMECFKAHSKQLVILDLIKRLVDDKILTKAVVGDPVLEQCKLLRNKTEHLKRETIKELMKLELFLITKEDKMPVSETYITHVMFTDMLKGVHEVEVKHAELKDLEKELKDKMSSKLMGEHSPDKKLHMVERKKVLYTFIDKVQSSQDVLERIYERLQKVKHDANRDDLENMAKEVLEKVDDQLKCVQNLEEGVIDKSKSDESLYVPLQDVQRIKDSTQRLKHRMKILLSELKSRTKALPEEDESYRDNENLPSVKKTFKELRNETNRYIRGVIKVLYGDEQEQEPKTINIRLLVKKSLDQLLWEQDQSIPVKQDKMFQSYLSDRYDADDPTAREYKNIKDRMNSLRHMHVFVAYEDQLPKMVRKVMWEFHELMKLRLSDKVELVMPDESNMKNKLEFISEIKTDERWSDIMIRTPTETTKFRNLRTPKLLRKTSLFDNMAVWSSSAMYDTQAPATCEITPERVKTLKNRRLLVDLKTLPCSTVLTMDCSSHDSLVVMSKPYHHDPEKKVITILTKERKVELTPDSSPRVLVKVDGVLVSEPKHGDFIKVPDKSKKHNVIVKYKDGKVEVRIPHVDLLVKSDGRKVSLKVPRFYRNKLCGVCGNSNKHGLDELYGPKQILYSDPHAFVSTYLVPESTCDPTTIQKLYGVPDVRKKSKLVKPEEETSVRTVTIKNVRKTCFSTKPVRKCPPGSEPEKKEHRLVSFYCIRSSDSQTKVYLDIVKRRVLDEVRNKRADRNEYIDMPIDCIKP